MPPEIPECRRNKSPPTAMGLNFKPTGTRSSRGALRLRQTEVPGTKRERASGDDPVPDLSLTVCTWLSDQSQAECLCWEGCSGSQ
jgi:hypothetical protein